MKNKFIIPSIIIAAAILGGVWMLKPPAEPPKAPDISILVAAYDGNIEAVKQHLAAGTDVNVKDGIGVTPLHFAVLGGHKELAELLIANGADVNLRSSMVVKTEDGSDGEQAAQEIMNYKTALDRAIGGKHMEIADLLRKHGGKTGEELKAEGK